MVAHPTALLGPTFGLVKPAAADRGALAEPWILRLTRADSVAHLLAELADGPGRDRLGAARVRPDARGLLVLEQPVHRSFNLVLLEARCLLPGLPRLDPAKILAAGLVVRRLIAVRAQQPARGGARLPDRRTPPPVRRVEQGWLVAGRTPVGWQTVPAAALLEDGGWEPDAVLRRERERPPRRRDPAAARPPAGPGGCAAVGDHSPLFPIPDELARRSGARCCSASCR